MRSFLKAILFCIIGSTAVQSQISGELYNDLLPVPFATIYLEGEKSAVRSDHNGFFELPISTEDQTCNLVIEFYELTLIISDIVIKENAMNFGKIILPQLKFIEPKEFKKLPKSEKLEYNRIAHWLQLIGYQHKYKLENDYLELNCSEEIIDFDYDIKSKTVKVDWSVVQNCQ